MRESSNQLVSFVSTADIETVLGRIPVALRARLRDVYRSRLSLGVRRLGSVRRRGRRDITLYSVLPPRVSLRRFVYRGQAASEFGAPARGQWPPWAVRRFLLYDVLLHEIGHLQVVDAKSTNFDRRYASETLAQRFADELRRELWCQPFDHPDPIHGPPSDAEFAVVALWERLDKRRRGMLVALALHAPYSTMPSMSEFEPLNPAQRGFLRQALCHA